jgi:probable LLM family oxidoreductase
MTQTIELALDTFGDVSVDGSGKPLSQAQVLRNVVEQGVLADQVGVDFFALGEHHRKDFSVSAPDVVLAAIAARTSRIHLGSAVTVLSSDDPIRVFQRFSTLNAISSGRAEVVVGRGSFTESFPLFGFDLSKYEELFEEKLNLFAELVKSKPVTWKGNTRSPLRDQVVYPPIENEGTLRTWIAVGGTPQSVVRAAHYGFPLMLAIIGGSARRFAPFVELYHKALERSGKPMQPVGAHSPGHVAATDELAREQLWPHYADLMNRIGRERGWAPIGRAHFENEANDGALVVGSPETVARKIVASMQALGLSRFELKYANGTMPHEQLMTSIELYGTKVAPMVREMMQ